MNPPKLYQRMLKMLLLREVPPNLMHLTAQREVHMGQQALPPQFGTSPARQLGLKQRTWVGPGPLHVEGALSHYSTAKPVALKATTLWRSTLTLWSGAQQYPQQVLSTLSSKGVGHA